MISGAQADGARTPAHSPVQCTDYPDLQQILLEASACLARLDADRLEDLAASCRMLMREPRNAEPAKNADLAQQAHTSQPALRVLGRVLHATHANLQVLRRLQVQQGQGPTPEYALSTLEEAADGNH